MPRNNQVTRQWLLLRRLEGSRGATLQDLVGSLPDDYPKNPRTIRRDLEALEATGFPLTVERVDGQTRWRFAEGFRNIPALGFSPTELMSLVFSRSLLKPLEGTEIQASLSSAMSKAASALPPQGHEYVREMEKVFSVGLGPHKSYRQPREIVTWDVKVPYYMGDGEPFEEKMHRLMAKLRQQQAEAVSLDTAITANLRELGHGR